MGRRERDREFYAMHDRLAAIRRGEDPFANSAAEVAHDMAMSRQQEAIRNGGDLQAAYAGVPGWDAAWNPRTRGLGHALGTVKFFNDEKRFGFITPDSGDGDVFFHRDSIALTSDRPLRQGARVSYIRRTGKKGPKALEIRIF
jgi:CspA family cold shock protein